MRVIITVRGGIAWDIVSDTPCDVMVIDYDEHEVDKDYVPYWERSLGNPQALEDLAANPFKNA